jgi:hypothetical protein
MSNRAEYVGSYVDLLLRGSVDWQLESMRLGFASVCDTEAIDLLCADELEAVMSGADAVDFDELERVTQYEGGYSADHQVVRWFWDAVKAMSPAERVNLLAFTTGSTRAPISGLGSIAFVVSREGAHSNRLPTSHTCFNQLLLPEYNSEVQLRKLLHLAIENNTGFGLK